MIVLDFEMRAVQGGKDERSLLVHLGTMRAVMSAFRDQEAFHRTEDHSIRESVILYHKTAMEVVRISLNPESHCIGW